MAQSQMMERRPRTMWEIYEDEWNLAIQYDDRRAIEGLWMSMNWQALHQFLTIPPDLHPWEYMADKMPSGGDGDEDIVLAPIVTAWVREISEWSRKATDRRFRR